MLFFVACREVLREEKCWSEVDRDFSRNAALLAFPVESDSGHADPGDAERSGRAGPGRGRSGRDESLDSARSHDWTGGRRGRRGRASLRVVHRFFDFDLFDLYDLFDLDPLQRVSWNHAGTRAVELVPCDPDPLGPGPALVFAPMDADPLWLAWLAAWLAAWSPTEWRPNCSL